MYKILEGKLRQEGITRVQLAKDLNLSISTVSEKLNQQERLKLNEARKIRDLYFPNETIDHLFFDGSNFKKSV